MYLTRCDTSIVQDASWHPLGAQITIHWMCVMSGWTNQWSVHDVTYSGLLDKDPLSLLPITVDSFALCAVNVAVWVSPYWTALFNPDSSCRNGYLGHIDWHTWLGTLWRAKCHGRLPHSADFMQPLTLVSNTCWYYFFWWTRISLNLMALKQENKVKYFFMLVTRLPVQLITCQLGTTWSIFILDMIWALHTLYKGVIQVLCFHASLQVNLCRGSWILVP